VGAYIDSKLIGEPDVEIERLIDTCHVVGMATDRVKYQDEKPVLYNGEEPPLKVNVTFGDELELLSRYSW